MSDLKEQGMDEQESLTPERLRLLRLQGGDYPDRPKESLIDLINWAQDHFSKRIDDSNSGYTKCFLHNKITIDGSFVCYAEENNLRITCFVDDGMTSWKTKYGNEHFISLGVYKVVSDGWSFLHCALFHKGNQNEDEVSFFILVSQGNYEKYLKLRDDFEEWEKKRDSSNLEIEVIGGEPIPYSRELAWEDLFLEEETKKQLITSIDGFNKSKEIYQKFKVPWKRGLLFWGPRGNGKTSTLKIIMSQYDFKPVTIHPGHPSPDELLDEAFEYAQEHSPALLFFEDLQEMLRGGSTRHFLNLLDGVQSRDGLLIIATGNDFSDLEENITSRPRRFDKKIYFPIPTLEMGKTYLSKWFSDFLSKEKIDELAQKGVQLEFTYTHFQEVFFNSVSIAIKNDRVEPNEEDIVNAMDEVMEEKSLSNSEGISSHRPLDLAKGYMNEQE